MAAAATAPAVAENPTTAAASVAVANTLHGHQSASLHCSGLAPEVNEGILYENFKSIGPVASIRVCRDNVTRRSLGYAYINFHNVADADRALSNFNYHTLMGREIHLSWSMRDPTLRKSGVGNIFIKNLDKSIDNKALHDIFHEFGTILSCKVMTDEKGVSRGFGFVHFERAESAENAIAKLNDMVINEKQVYVGHHISRRERLSKVEESKKNFTNVYVKFIDPAVTDEEFRDLFAKYGEITSYKIARDTQEASKGFGFVNFAEHEAAAKAVEELHNSEFRGKKLYVTRAQKRAERTADLQRRRMERQQKTQESNVYIKNLDDSITDDRLRQEFSQFGTITSAKVITDEKGISRGFGFVCFAEADEATKAITAMQGKNFGNKPIFLAIAMRKDQRQAMLQAQHSQPRAMAPYGMYNAPMFMQPRQMYYPPQQMGRPRFPAGPAVPAGANRGPAAAYPSMYPPMMPRAAGPPRGAPRRPIPNAQGARQMGAPGNGPRRTFTAEQLDEPAARQELGGIFYQQVMMRTGGNTDTSAKVTGMLLTLPSAELVTLHNVPEELNARIEDAMQQLNEVAAAPAPESR